MKRVLLAMLVVGTALAPLRAASWEDEKKVWEEQANAFQEKDPGYAAKLALNFLPIDNGHFYVGEVGKGIWFSVGQTVGLVALAIPVLNSQSRSKDEELRPIWTSGMIVTAAVGGLTYMGLKVWSAYDAAAGAERYNKRMAEKRKQAFQWGIHPKGVTLSRRF